MATGSALASGCGSAKKARVQLCLGRSTIAACVREVLRKTVATECSRWKDTYGVAVIPTCKQCLERYRRRQPGFGYGPKRLHVVLWYKQTDPKVMMW